MKFIKSNKLVTDLTASLAKQLIEVSKTLTVAAGSSVLFSANINYDTFDIRTIYALSDTGDPVTISLFDAPAGGNELYRSLNQAIINDIVAVPCRDKSGNKNLYVQVTNSSTMTYNVNILLKIVNL